jgi:hypothetical protein
MAVDWLTPGALKGHTYGSEDGMEVLREPDWLLVLAAELVVSPYAHGHSPPDRVGRDLSVPVLNGRRDGALRVKTL